MWSVTRQEAEVEMSSGRLSTRGNVLQSARPRLCRKSIVRLMLCLRTEQKTRRKHAPSNHEQGSNTSGLRCCPRSAQQADTADHVCNTCMWNVLGGKAERLEAAGQVQGIAASRAGSADAASTTASRRACDAGAELPTQGKLQYRYRKRRYHRAHHASLAILYLVPSISHLRLNFMPLLHGGVAYGVRRRTTLLNCHGDLSDPIDVEPVALLNSLHILAPLPSSPLSESGNVACAAPLLNLLLAIRRLCAHPLQPSTRPPFPRSLALLSYSFTSSFFHSGGHFLLLPSLSFNASVSTHAVIPRIPLAAPRLACAHLVSFRIAVTTITTTTFSLTSSTCRLLFPLALRYLLLLLLLLSSRVSVISLLSAPSARLPLCCITAALASRPALASALAPPPPFSSQSSRYLCTHSPWPIALFRSGLLLYTRLTVLLHSDSTVGLPATCSRPVPSLPRPQAQIPSPSPFPSALSVHALYAPLSTAKHPDGLSLVHSADNGRLRHVDQGPRLG